MKIAREKICFYSSMYAGRSSSYEIIDCAERHGVGGVELMNFSTELNTPDVEVARKIGRYARERGLLLPCFSVGIDAIANPEEAIKTLRKYAEICSELEIPYLHHTIALEYRCGRLPTEEREKRFNTGMGIALSLADYCAPLGVKTLIEPQGFVFNGIDWIDRAVRLSGEKIGVVADVGNVYFADTDPVCFVKAMKDRILHAHIKDYAKFEGADPVASESGTKEIYVSEGGYRFIDREMGCGDIDIGAVVCALSDVGYGGMYSLEFEAASGDGEVERVLKRLC